MQTLLFHVKWYGRLEFNDLKLAEWFRDYLPYVERKSEKTPYTGIVVTSTAQNRLFNHILVMFWRSSLLKAKTDDSFIDGQSIH